MGFLLLGVYRNAKDLKEKPTRFKQMSLLRQYIQHLYFKRFGKERPDEIPSIEEKIRSEEEKKARRREAKLQGILAKANKQEPDEA